MQGRFVTETEVDEIPLLLRSHSSWPRSRLSRELCARWELRRPNGQIKDMAAAIIFHFLIGLNKLKKRSQTGTEAFS